MKIEVAEHGRMSESGSSLLRLIQNQDIPLLDLVVRESIQNSLDAANKSYNSVDVDITVGEFQSNELNRHFECVENGLNRRFPSSKGKYSFISFRDRNTVGLTGPVRYDDLRNNEFGNLLKLVYEICKPQQNEGAGGSWGLGKTIYFRLGIGLVIYYSRIEENGKYQSRLAACLVEDETKEDSLIQHRGGVKRGIAWWGKEDELRSKSTVPLDNENEIEKILSVFGLVPYSENQTGTTVIIPYVDKDALLAEVYAKNDVAEQKPYWASSVEEYLRIAIQRWYAPRLLNPKYLYGKYLSVWFNGLNFTEPKAKLKVSDMLPTFRLIRDFYILAQGGKIEDTSLVSEHNLECSVEKIELRGVLNSIVAGNLVFGKFTRSQMLMDHPYNNKSPYQQITNVDVDMEGGNGPIIMYTRRPGMIVGYDYDGTWTHRMPKSGPDEFIIGLFVANTENTLKHISDPRTGAAMSLEEYIRQGEKADHASWTDRNIKGHNPRIITKVQQGIINKIKKQYNESVKVNFERQNIGLGHALANLLLPAEDFGSLPTPSPGPNPPEIHPKQRTIKSNLQIKETIYRPGQVVVNVEIGLRGKKCEISLQVVTDYKRYEADAWENELTKEFPVEFFDVKLERFTAKGRPSTESVSLDEVHTVAENSNAIVEYRSSKKYGHNCYIIISPKDFTGKVTGYITFNVHDPQVRGYLEIKEID